MPEALIGALATALAAAVAFLTALQDHWRRLAGAERRLTEELHAARKALITATDKKRDEEHASLPKTAAADLTLPTWDDGEAKSVLMSSMGPERRRQVETTAR